MPLKLAILKGKEANYTEFAYQEHQYKQSEKNNVLNKIEIPCFDKAKTQP